MRCEPLTFHAFDLMEYNGMDTLKLGLTGTQDLPDHGLAQAGVLLTEMRMKNLEVEEVHSGGCFGWDTFAGFQCVLLWPQAVHHIWLPLKTDKLSYWWKHRLPWGVEPVLHVTRDYPGYRERNAEIVDRSTHLFCGPRLDEESQRRSGTWMTVRMGRKAGLPLLFLQSGASEREMKLWDEPGVNGKGWPMVTHFEALLVHQEEPESSGEHAGV